MYKRNIDFKDIHIGKMICQCVGNRNVAIERICKFFKCSESEIKEMFLAKSLDADILMRWSKLLEYDFFRLYTQHLILYAPHGKASGNTLTNNPEFPLPQFRKNIYTKELIDFIMELIESGEKTKLQIIQEYRIPKSTLHKWIIKYKK